MQKMGYQEGTGLGRFGQGISQALKVERTGKNLGLIVNQEQPQEVERKRFKQGQFTFCFYTNKKIFRS